MFGSGCKQVRFCASRNLNSELTALPETLARNLSNLPNRSCWQKKTLLVELKQPKYNSKRYKQVGEVELAAPYRLETAQKKTKYGQIWKAFFWALRERLLHEKGWYHNVCQASKCTLHICYIPVLEWLRQKSLCIYEWFHCHN